MATLATGCDDDGGGPLAVVCPDIAHPAVVVTPLDARTGVADATDARGVVVDGSYSDSLRIANILPSGRPASLAAATERPGTYTIRVERPGYRPAVQGGVVAARGSCGVVTAQVAVWLYPE